VIAQPVRLRQLRVQPEPCTAPAIAGFQFSGYSSAAGRIGSQYAGTEDAAKAACFHEYGSAATDTSPWRGIQFAESGEFDEVEVPFRSGLELRSGAWMARNPQGMAKWYDGGGHVVDFPTHLNEQQFRRGLKRLRELGWTDQRTRLGERVCWRGRGGGEWEGQEERRREDRLHTSTTGRVVQIYVCKFMFACTLAR